MVYHSLNFLCVNYFVLPVHYLLLTCIPLLLLLVALSDELCSVFFQQHGVTQLANWMSSYTQTQIAAVAGFIGTLYYDTYLDKAPYKEAPESGHDWVIRTLHDPTECYNMFRMTRPVFDRLHTVLVESYGLTSTKKMSSLEALALFLWICGAPQSIRQAQNRFARSSETCSRKFDKVLKCVCKFACHIINPLDREFRTVHRRLQTRRFSPYFDNCIGAIDGTHIKVVVPLDKVVQHTGRHGYTTQNVLAICDFDMRFTFVVAGWPGSVHDMRVFKDAVNKYAHRFPFPPEGILFVHGTYFLLVYGTYD